MNNFIKHYGILMIGLGICGVSLLICVYQESEEKMSKELKTQDNHFLTQIIVSKDLSKNNQKWLTLLSRDLDKSDAKRVVSQLELLTEESEKQHGDSVLQVAVQENEEIFDKIKEEGNMCEALRKLMEPEIREEVNKAVDKAIKYAEENNRKDMIAKALNVGSSAEDISRVMGIPLAEVEAIAKKH